MLPILHVEGTAISMVSIIASHHDALMQEPPHTKWLLLRNLRNEAYRESGPNPPFLIRLLFLSSPYFVPLGRSVATEMRVVLLVKSGLAGLTVAG